MAEGQQGGQDIQGLMRVLKQKGIPSSELIQLFGPMLGVGGASNNYDDLFAQYMPTFMQINQYEPENSLRRSVAAEVMAGTPIWQIEEGIANAISSGDAGVSPSARYEDYVGLAKTLANEYQSYSTQSSKPGNQSAFDKYGIPRPEERYTVEQFFPDAMASLAQIEKDNPRYKTGAVGSGAVLPAKQTENMSNITSNNATASAMLKVAEEALNSGVNKVAIDGRQYSLTELRDQLIPSLKKEVSKEKSLVKKQSEKADTLLGTYNNQQYVVDQANLEYLRALDNFKANKYNVTEDTLTKLKSKLDGAKEDKAMLGRQLDFYSKDLKNVPAGAGANIVPKMNVVKPGPGGYVGPAGGESTMARTFDPYEMQIRKGVVPVLEERLAKSGRTPQLDALYRLATSGVLGK
jgi:hypothetical protein